MTEKNGIAFLEAECAKLRSENEKLRVFIEQHGVRDTAPTSAYGTASITADASVRYDSPNAALKPEGYLFPSRVHASPYPLASNTRRWPRQLPRACARGLCARLPRWHGDVNRSREIGPLLAEVPMVASLLGERPAAASLHGRPLDGQLNLRFDCGYKDSRRQPLRRLRSQRRSPR
jgi:hypothetical protein